MSIDALIKALQTKLSEQLETLQTTYSDISLIDQIAQYIQNTSNFKIDTEGPYVYIDGELVATNLIVDFDKFKLFFRNKINLILATFSNPIGQYLETNVYYDDDSYSELYLGSFQNLQLIKTMNTFSELQKKINAIKLLQASE